MVTLCKILTKKDNFFVMLHIYVYNPLQKVFELFQKILDTFIISESIKFLIEKSYREVISKI